VVPQTPIAGEEIRVTTIVVGTGVPKNRFVAVHERPDEPNENQFTVR
jgi:hypothetical protein